MFGKNLLKTSIFVKKKTISDRNSELLWKLVFLNNFCYGQILGIIFLMETTALVQTSEIGQILTKTVYDLKMSHVYLNYALQLFWIIFGKFCRKLLFLEKKWQSQKEAENYSED